MQKSESNVVVAHRGAFKKNGLPENSIASLQEAMRLGCVGSEFDVRMSADDSLLVNHDPHFQGMDIEKTNFAQLSRYALSNNEPLPLLRSYLEAGRQNPVKTTLVLEIKPSGVSKERGKLIAGKVLKLVDELNLAHQMMYISFDYEIVKHIHVLKPGAHVQYLNGDKSPAELKADGVNGLDYHFSVFKRNPQWITEAKSLGIVLNAWTVNDAETLDWMLEQGFNYITTNEPELLFERILLRAK